MILVPSWMPPIRYVQQLAQNQLTAVKQSRLHHLRRQKEVISQPSSGPSWFQTNPKTPGGSQKSPAESAFLLAGIFLLTIAARHSQASDSFASKLRGMEGSTPEFSPFDLLPKDCWSQTNHCHKESLTKEWIAPIHLLFSIQHKDLNPTTYGILWSGSPKRCPLLWGRNTFPNKKVVSPEVRHIQLLPLHVGKLGHVSLLLAEFKKTLLPRNQMKLGWTPKKWIMEPHSLKNIMKLKTHFSPRKLATSSLSGTGRCFCQQAADRTSAVGSVALWDVFTSCFNQSQCKRITSLHGKKTWEPLGVVF